MASATTIGELNINLKMRLEGLEKGIETAKKKLQEIESQNKNLQSSNKALDTSFLAMSAGIIASLVKIKSAVDDGVNRYNTYRNSMTALQKTAKATNNAFSDIKNMIEDVNSLKLMDDSDVTAATKNLLTYGFTVEQTSDILKVLQDAAVGNRQANYTLSEAVRVTTEGIRMENSVLSDAAGVQKNISKMYEEYAQKIGKTRDSLTQAEKSQAVYNGIMAEATMFVGSAAEMAQGYQGVQSQLNATNLELSRTIGEVMIPALTQYKSLQLSITKGLTEFVKKHKSATSGMITFSTSALGMIVALTGLKKMISAYVTTTNTANAVTKLFTASLMANPLFWGGLAISSGLALTNMYITAVQESIDELNEATEKAVEFDDAMKHFTEDYMFTDEEKKAVEERRNKAEETINVYTDLNNKIVALENEKEKLINQKNSGEITEIQFTTNALEIADEIKKAKEAFEDFKNVNMISGTQSFASLKESVSTMNQALELSALKQKYLSSMNAKTHRETLINIAQTKADVQGKQQLLNVLKKGETATDEYANAKSQLVKAYPELARVNENTINSTQAMIDAENNAAEAEWALAQVQIAESIVALQSMLKNDEEYTKIAEAMKVETEQVTASLKNQINVLTNLAQLTPADFAGSITSSYTPKATYSSSGAYSNKALDNYKKQIEHKKALDKINLNEEINMYEYALRVYARTTDEKMELREKIYELNKELANKEKELIDQQTEDYEAYMQAQKNLRGAEYDMVEQTNDYNKIISIHKNYLNQIMKDERLSLEERKSIYREELETIRDYEQQKRDLRVESIDNTVVQLTSAITKQLEEMQKKDKELIDKNIEEVEKWKEIRINAINAEYDAKIEAIEKELEALDKAEQQKSRDEEDAEHEKKKKRLEDLIAYEHDATTKANYQKELDKLIAEYQKTLDKRALEDRKEALNAEKDLLQNEQDNKVQAVEDEVEKQKEIYNKQLEDLEKYYSDQIDLAQETAEKMLLNVQENQNNIINLLKKYGDKYELTGQSLGEKLAQGINDGLTSKIENVIQKIQDTIDSNLEAKIKEWTASSYKYEAGVNKPNIASKTITVTQNNYIEQNPEMPSETYRKLNNVSQNLAAELLGI